jgi:hypothetical protein
VGAEDGSGDLKGRGMSKNCCGGVIGGRDCDIGVCNGDTY